MDFEPGMGHVRLSRAAMLAVPSALAAAGMGAAMLQGMVGATLSSAQGFTLQSTAIHSSGLKLRPGVATVAGGNSKTLYAETGTTTSAHGVDINAAVNTGLPLIGTITLSLSSSDPQISLGSIILNAKDLTVADKNTAVNATNASNSAAALQNVDLGIAQSQAGFTDTTDAAGKASGYSGDGFAITAGNSDLNNVNAQAFAIHLAGLAVDQLSISVH